VTPGQELHLGRTANSITVMFQLVIELCKLIIVNNITPQTPSLLSPEILQKVYEGAITLSPAVELSYLSEEQQKVLLDAMSLNDCTPSHAQSIRMKKSAQQTTLSLDSIYKIMSEEKANQTEHICFKVQDLRSFFPKNYTQKQMSETILKLFYDYHRKTERKRSSRDER
jgi:ParB family chromosome partitioning protein